MTTEVENKILSAEMKFLYSIKTDSRADRISNSVKFDDFSIY